MKDTNPVSETLFNVFTDNVWAGMAEILAMEMKSAGMYVSRGLSYKQAEVGMAFLHQTINMVHV